jgi:formyl-CoA transferase
VTELLDVPELKTDPRFQERDTRKKNRKALTPLLEEPLRKKTTEEWVEILNSRGVPSGAILGLEEALTQAQIRHRGTLEQVHADGIGELKLFGLSAQFEKTPGSVDSPPPRLAAHTDEILGSLGCSKEDLARLRNEGVI